jgi:cysteine desulfuration protein SufE
LAVSRLGICGGKMTSGMLKSDLDELLDTFDLLEEWEERYAYIIELGAKLPPLPEAHRIDANKVEGCLSTVWLVPSLKEGKLDFYADSDAAIVKGLVAILLTIFRGKTPEEALQLDVDELFAKMGLKQHLSSTRRNGLYAMVKRVKLFAASQVAG